MAANKVKGIRACCCSDSFSCEYTRRHNDANALCLGGRVVGAGLACQLVDLFLSTPFEGGRHENRIAKDVYKRQGVALAAKADDCDGLAVQHSQVAVGIVIFLDGHDRKLSFFVLFVRQKRYFIRSVEMCIRDRKGSARPD